MRQRVLIIDDEPPIRHLCARVLAPSHDVVEADGLLAARPFVEDGVDLVLLDIMMPGVRGVDGIDMIRTWTKGSAHLPILMLTALHDADARVEALGAGADDFLTKPFHAAELRLRVSNFLRSRAQDVLIRQQRDQLIESLSLRDELMAMVVHDLRNPLTSVLAALEFLQEDKTLSEASCQDVADGLAAARRVNTVTSDILRLITANAGHPLQLQFTDLRHLIERAASSLAGAARSRGVSLAVDGGAAIDVDPGLVLRAAENLIGNAIRYAPAGTTVHVSLCDGGEYAELCVEDRGPGVPEELRTAIFRKRFHSGESPHQSYGLGLYLVDIVARAHGGEAGVRGRDGGGAAFFLRLNRGPVTPQRQAFGEVAGDPSPGQG